MAGLVGFVGLVIHAWTVMAPFKLRDVGMEDGSYRLESAPTNRSVKLSFNGSIAMRRSNL
jgi:hypothetical protein